MPAGPDARALADADDAGAFLDAGNALSDAGDQAGAEAFFRAAADLGSEDGWYDLGNSLARQGRPGEAVTAFLRAAAEGVAEAWLSAGLAYEDLRDCPLARFNDYPTNFRAMAQDDLDAVSTRGEQLTRALLAHCCPRLVQTPTSGDRPRQRAAPSRPGAEWPVPHEPLPPWLEPAPGPSPCRRSSTPTPRRPRRLRRPAGRHAAGRPRAGRRRRPAAATRPRTGNRGCFRCVGLPRRSRDRWNRQGRSRGLLSAGVGRFAK